MQRQRSIFISHKHADKKIATELRTFLNQWSRGEVPVYQSSAPQAQGPRLGYALTDELKKGLWDAGVVLLVYTTEDQDWSYCMWECGVATKPESPQTRIIVLQCAAEAPRVFEDQVRVDVRDQDDVLKFVTDYLTDPGFFPGVDTALAPKLPSDLVKQAATDLYSKLSKVIPKRDVSEWPAQPFVRLELKIDEIEKPLGSAGTQADFGKSAMVREMDPRAWHIFGIANVDATMSLGALLQHWAEGRTDVSKAWIEDLQAQVMRAAHREIPVPRWTQLAETDGLEGYTPVLTRVRQVPALDTLQFDVSLVPFEAAKVLAAIGDPYLQAYSREMKEVESFAQSLVPYFTPIAVSFFNQWSDYVRKVVSDGALMRGPERLEITRMLVLATKKHMLAERVVANPLAKKHSLDWLAFYDEIGGRPDIDKAWMLCIEESEARSKASEIEVTWKFFKDRKFKTLYCSPRDVELAIGETVNDHEVIEVFGEYDYVKLLSLPGGSYTADDSKNVLVTIFRAATPKDRRLLQSMMGCASVITEDWLRSLRNTVAQ